MIRRIKAGLAPAVIPFALAIAFSIFITLYRIAGLPSPTDIAFSATSFYKLYGNTIILPSAYIEGIFMISLYFPGSFVILIGVFASDKTLISLAALGLTAWFGFMLAGITNYFLGKFGYYRLLLFLGRKDSIVNMQRWLSQHGKIAIFLSAFHPNFLSVALVCAGITRRNFIRTIVLAGVSQLFWIAFWIVVGTPILQNVNMEDPNQAWYLVLLLILWGFGLIARDRIKSRA